LFLLWFEWLALQIYRPRHVRVSSETLIVPSA
jgi:hypothetical protein